MFCFHVRVRRVEKKRWSKTLSRLSFVRPISDGSLSAPSRHGRPTVPSSLSPVVNIRSLIHPVQCQQFKRAQFVFLSISISVILLRVARSHFITRAPSKGVNVWRLLLVTTGMTQYFPRVFQCTRTHCTLRGLTAVDNFFFSFFFRQAVVKEFSWSCEWFLYNVRLISCVSNYAFLNSMGGSCFDKKKKKFPPISYIQHLVHFFCFFWKTWKNDLGHYFKTVSIYYRLYVQNL